MDVREKLVELLENHCAVIGEDHCKASQSGECAQRDCAICLASDLIANGVTVQEWIPVTERLPETFVSVLAYIPSEVPMPTIHESYIADHGAWVRISTGERYKPYAVTHWMPLPEPLEDGTA